MEEVTDTVDHCHMLSFVPPPKYIEVLIPGNWDWDLIWEKISL